MSTTSKPAIGFIGLGAMGFGMATHLVKQGYPVRGFDVWQPTLDRFKAAGGLTAATPGEAVRGCEYCICMVASAPQAQAALFDAEDPAVKSLPKDATLLLASTVPASFAESVESQLAALSRGDIYFIDCPVSGGTARASTGELTIMAGGSAAALARGNFLLDELTAPSKLFVVAGGIGAGSNMKMVHQVLAGIHILVSSEAIGLAARLGLDPKKTFESVVSGEGSDAWNWMFENRVPRALTEDYFPAASALTIILKDLGIISSTGRLQRFPTPLATAAEQVFLSGVAAGWAAQDDASMVRLYFPTALSSFKPSTPAGITLSEPERTQLVHDLLSSVHLVAAVEGFAFTTYLGLDLEQYFALCADAAGASWSFRNHGPEIIALFSGKSAAAPAKAPAGITLDQRIDKLSKVLSAAKDVGCPLYLGSEVLGLLGLARRRAGGDTGEVKALVTGLWGTK